MSCHGCAAKFGILEKEIGCPGCGFSYCGKCLRYKAILPKLGKTSQLVCRNCYKRLENKDTSSEMPLPPSQAFIKTLESLENPDKPPIVVYLEDTRLKNLKHGLNDVDREILNRLEKLRKERKQQPAPNEDEIARRLATLKGLDPDHMEAASRKQIYMMPDARSDVEKTNDLVKQFLEEKELSSKLVKPEEEITNRLSALRGEMGAPSKQQENIQVPVVPNTDKPDDLLARLKSELTDTECLSERTKKLSIANKMSVDESSSDEEEIAENIVRRAVDEASLPNVIVADPGQQNKQFSEEMDSELPWCIICNEDATKRCHGCDGDLYCDKCYAEGHDVWGMKEHKTSPFK